MNINEKAIQEFAVQQGVEYHSVKSLFQYILLRLENDDAREFFFKYPELSMNFLIKKWLSDSETFFNKVLDKNSEEHQFILNELNKQIT